MLTEKQFTHLVARADHCFPQLMDKMEQLHGDFPHWIWKQEELEWLVRQLPPVTDLPPRTEVLAIWALSPIGRKKRTLVIAKNTLFVVHKDAGCILRKLPKPYLHLEYDSLYTNALSQLLSQNGWGKTSTPDLSVPQDKKKSENFCGNWEAELLRRDPEMKKLPLAHRHYALFPVGSTSDTSRAVWLNPATIYEIKDGAKKYEATLIHTTYAMTFAVDISRRTLMHHLQLATVCHGYFRRSACDTPYNPQSSLSHFLGYESTPALDSVFQNLDVCHLPGRDGDFMELWKEEFGREYMRRVMG